MRSSASQHLKTIGSLVLMLLLAATARAQNWQTATNTTYLNSLSAELDRAFQEYKQSAQIYALERNIPIRQVFDNGTTISLIRIMPSGLAEYYKSDNQQAAQNVGTVRLRPRANLGLNLTGKNFLIGVWDSGSINSDHQELSGRIDIRDNIPYDDHGTHVAGTIGATGINPQAKGMAFEADMFAYEFNNDNSEMAAEAAEGLTISNHSYGLRTGWDVANGGTGWQWFGDPGVSSVEDYRFGYYDASNSRVWDDIAFNAPYYLIIKSAGNDRTDVGDGTRPPDGPYDCLEPKSVAKNILTIGAVDHLAGAYNNPNEVVMSDFSSWGPTDDGRIKPDISAIGVDVFSTLAESPTAYGTLSGTSMSAPNTTGSLALLQQYHEQLYAGRIMKSATLKGLVIHTANEAGKNPGPDYEFGWGLLAVDKAASLMTRANGIDFIIEELKLAENDSIVYNVNAEAGKTLIATICWTDVPGTPAPISLDPARLMLVNDLDMRIYEPDGKRNFPWILDPASPEKAASKGDNFRDNVEKIEIDPTVSGTYRIVIRHKNTLRNKSQEVSLIVSNASPSISLATYYRIGGGGDWNDPSKWSLNSGGASANAVPGASNPVIFDNNSFSAANNTISLNSAASCYNINYYTSDSCSINLSSFTLNVDGSLYDENEKLSFANGKISFVGTLSKNNQIMLSPKAFNNVDLEFVSLNGSWHIKQDFDVNNLLIQNSSVLAIDKTINARVVVINNTPANIVDLSQSEITGINALTVAPLSEVELMASSIILNGSNGIFEKTIASEDITYHNISVSNANLSVIGDNSFNSISANGDLSLFDNNIIDSLSLSQSGSLVLGEGTTLLVRRAFAATGVPENRIEISSVGPAEASIVGNDGNIRFCFDYLDITNVTSGGATSFFVGDNSILDAASTGWLALDCNDVLFPSFDVLYPCAMGEVKFVDSSTGFPSKWQWNFGNLQFPSENTSTLQNPFHQFRFEGEYEVTLNVKNALFDQTITRTIEIKDIESGLSVPSININGTRLTASIIAPEYQWYYNNVAIPGANTRVYDIVNPGVYYVTVSDQNCLFRSEPTVVTSTLDVEKPDEFAIYPNPSSGDVNLRWANSYYGKGRIDIYDFLGNKVYSREIRKNSPVYELTLQLPAHTQGLLTVILQTENGSYASKIVVKP
ncbi:MAG: S8 family serine peptidase [Cyclobacteriaceae bacterium]|nr:S8 family serine peptidase [Cyclobacteriaceae bacterium]